MAAMATCTQVFAGMRLNLAAKVSLRGKAVVARPVMMARAAGRSARMTVRAADDDASAATEDAPDASNDDDEDELSSSTSATMALL